MTWTSEKPTAPGFYWHRAPGRRAQVCEVFESLGEWVVAFPIGRGEYDWLSLPDDSDLPTGSEWSGPLENPR